jgi:hypothetical protein
VGKARGTIARYVYAGGGGGFVISDDSGLTRLYEDALSYSSYVSFETRPLLTVDDGVPAIGDWLGS